MRAKIFAATAALWTFGAGLTITTVRAAWDQNTIAKVTAVTIYADGSGLELRFDRSVCPIATQDSRYGIAYINDVYDGLTVNTTGLQQMLSLATAAILSGRNMRVHAMNGGWGCHIGSLELL